MVGVNNGVRPEIQIFLDILKIENQYFRSDPIICG
jgi:hypothetical protein